MHIRLTIRTSRAPTADQRPCADPARHRLMWMMLLLSLRLLSEEGGMRTTVSHDTLLVVRSANPAFQDSVQHQTGHHWWHPKAHCT